MNSINSKKKNYINPEYCKKLVDSICEMFKRNSSMSIDMTRNYLYLLEPFYLAFKVKFDKYGPQKGGSKYFSMNYFCFNDEISLEDRAFFVASMWSVMSEYLSTVAPEYSCQPVKGNEMECSVLFLIDK